MLIMARRLNETITINPVDANDADDRLSEVFSGEPIEIKLLKIERKRVLLAISAPRQFRIWRGSYQEHQEEQEDQEIGCSE